MSYLKELAYFFLVGLEAGLGLTVSVTVVFGFLLANAFVTYSPVIADLFTLVINKNLLMVKTIAF